MGEERQTVATADRDLRRSMTERGAELLEATARARGLMNYSTFNERACDGSFDLSDVSQRAALGALLGEISRQSVQDHDVMLSALVHLKGQQSEVGAGFYKLAQELGRLPISANAEARLIHLGREMEKVWTWAGRR